MYPSKIDPDGPLARSVAKECRSQNLDEPKMFYSNGALDAGLYTALGSKAAMWGPGDMDLRHTENECIGVDDLVNVAKAG